jgi:hypothetical protein
LLRLAGEQPANRLAFDIPFSSRMLLVRFSLMPYFLFVNGKPLQFAVTIALDEGISGAAWNHLYSL